MAVCQFIPVLCVLGAPYGAPNTQNLLIAVLPPRSNGKTKGCYCSCWAPDDGREDARSMLSCTQTSSNKLEKLLRLGGWYVWNGWWCTDLQILIFKPTVNSKLSTCFIKNIIFQNIFLFLMQSLFKPYFNKIYGFLIVMRSLSRVNISTIILFFRKFLDIA